MIGSFSVIMITGPRQAGKKTLLNNLILNINKNVSFVSFNNLLLRAKAKEDPEQFLKSYDTPLIIDEFQYVPELLIYIKIRVDEMRKKALFEDSINDTIYYLTGSQVFETMEDVSESLAGRVGILDLYGLSTREINGKLDDLFIPDINLIKKRERLDKLTEKQLFDRIFNGSYPNIYTDDSLDREVFYEDYIRTYMERDVRKAINIKDEYKFIMFISCLAALTGQEYNALKIASTVGIDSKTVDDWLSVLKNTNIIYLLQPYSNNDLSKAIKRPKIYFMDTGLACYLARYVSSETLQVSVYSGAIFETYVVSEIIKNYSNNGKNAKRYLYYYRDNNGVEIDLIINYDNVIYPIEIKKNSNPGINAIKNFNVLKNKNINVGNGLVLCMIDDIFNIDDNNYYVPIDYI